MKTDAKTHSQRLSQACGILLKRRRKKYRSQREHGHHKKFLLIYTAIFVYICFYLFILSNHHQIEILWFVSSQFVSLWSLFYITLAQTSSIIWSTYGENWNFVPFMILVELFWLFLHLRWCWLCCCEAF